MFDTTSLHELDVSCILVVEISCNIACVVISDFSRCVRESVPDAWPASTFGGCPLILRTQKSASVKRETARALHAVNIDIKQCLSAYEIRAEVYLI